MQLLPRRRLGRVLIAILSTAVLVVAVLVGSTGWLVTFGAAPTGKRLERILRSPNYRDGSFRNPAATSIMSRGSFWGMLRQWIGGHEQRVPPGPIPTVSLTRADFAQPPTSGLRATWLGHSTVLVEIDGARILFDPVWARRASPSSLVGPKRFFKPPLALEDLPPLDAILAPWCARWRGAPISSALGSSFRSGWARTWSDGG